MFRASTSARGDESVGCGLRRGDDALDACFLKTFAENADSTAVVKTVQAFASERAASIARVGPRL